MSKIATAVTRTERPLGMISALMVQRKTQESYLTDEGKRLVKGKGSPMRTSVRAPSRGKSGSLGRLSLNGSPPKEGGTSYGPW